MRKHSASIPTMNLSGPFIWSISRCMTWCSTYNTFDLWYCADFSQSIQALPCNMTSETTNNAKIQISSFSAHLVMPYTFAGFTEYFWTVTS